MTKVLLVAATALAALTTAAPDVTVLAARAENLLHAQRPFRKAVLLEADGMTAATNHKVRAARGIVKWRFVFDNQATGGKYKSATVLAVRSHLGKVRGNTSPFLEDEPIQPIPTMTLARAITLLRKAGYTKGFYAVTLRKPLSYPPTKHTEYIFTLDHGKWVAVDTKTGHVRPIS